MPHSKRVILISCILVVICLFSMDLYTPSLPAIVNALNAPQALIRNLVIAYLIGLSTSQLFYGPLSDRFGRKPILLIATLICLLGNVLSIFVHTGTELLFTRLLTGLGSGGCTIISRTILRDTFSEKKQLTHAFSYFAMASTASPALAPVIGGFLQMHFSWQSNFIVLSVFTFATVIMAVVYFPETLQDQLAKLTLRSFFSGYALVCSNVPFLAYSFMSALVFSISIGYYINNPFIFQTGLGLNASENSFFYILYALGLFLGAKLTSRLVQKIEGGTLVKYAALLLLWIALLTLLINCLGEFNVYTVCIPTFFIAICCGIQAPVLIALSIAPFKENAGTASALQGVIKTMGAAIVLILFSFVSIHSQLPLSVFFCSSSVLNLMMLKLAR